MRIVSLLPSATEIICGLGLRYELVGVTHECDYPSDVVELPRVTQNIILSNSNSAEIDNQVRQQLQDSQSLYLLDEDLLESLRPDLIVTQNLCEVCAVSMTAVQRVISRIEPRPQVVNLQPQRLPELYDSIRLVAGAANCPETAEDYIAQLQHRVSLVVARGQKITSRPKVLLLEWIDPLFSAGHWNPELVELAGGIEIIGKIGQPSRTISWCEIADAEPEVLLISCCGFDISRTVKEISLLESHSEWHKLPCVQEKNVFVVDGSAYFSRPGPRLIDSLELLAHTLHPQHHPLPSHLQPALKYYL